MAYKNIECITYNVTGTDPVDILNYSTYSKFDTRWYANTLKVTNVSSSVATISLYSSYTSESNASGGADLTQYEVQEIIKGRGNASTTSIDNYIVKNLAIPVGVTLVLEQDDLYFKKGYDLQFVSNNDVDVNLEVIDSSNTVHKNKSKSRNAY